MAVDDGATLDGTGQITLQGGSNLTVDGVLSTNVTFADGAAATVVLTAPADSASSSCSRSSMPPRRGITA